MSELKDIKEEHRVDVAKSFLAGVIFGLFALTGTIVGNFIWYQLLEQPELIPVVGWGTLIIFVALAVIIFKAAYGILKA